MSKHLKTSWFKAFLFYIVNLMFLWFIGVTLGFGKNVILLLCLLSTVFLRVYIFCVRFIGKWGNRSALFQDFANASIKIHDRMNYLLYRRNDWTWYHMIIYMIYILASSVYTFLYLHMLTAPFHSPFQPSYSILYSTIYIYLAFSSPASSAFISPSITPHHPSSAPFSSQVTSMTAHMG